MVLNLNLHSFLSILSFNPLGAGGNYSAALSTLLAGICHLILLIIPFFQSVLFPSLV
jgi:hypothetical protein